MDLERIQYRGFKPREEMDRDVRRVAQKILDEAPAGGKARLVISDQGGAISYLRGGHRQKQTL